MVDEYNCFKECKENPTCPGYFGMKDLTCVYKTVAQNDTRKFVDGRTDITLVDMLQKHYNVKLNIKELSKKNGE